MRPALHYKNLTNSQATFTVLFDIPRCSKNSADRQDKAIQPAFISTLSPRDFYAWRYLPTSFPGRFFLHYLQASAAG